LGTYAFRKYIFVRSLLSLKTKSIYRYNHGNVLSIHTSVYPSEWAMGCASCRKGALGVFEAGVNAHPSIPLAIVNVDPYRMNVE
jgi:hypothetical protein